MHTHAARCTSTIVGLYHAEQNSALNSANSRVKYLASFVSGAESFILFESRVSMRGRC